MSTNHPPFLRKGSKTGILSTARKITAATIQPIINELQSWGLEVIPGETIGLELNQFAGTDEQRAKDLQHFLDDPDIEAILCARGGYGTVRMIDKIDFSCFKKNPKWICGFSDVTVLHSHIHQNFGIPTIHSLMPGTFKDTDESRKALTTLREALFGESLSYQDSSGLKNLKGLGRTGKAEGILVGGNLSILHSLTGSKSDINTDGKILVIEDLDEYLYHIDRMITSLKRAGKLAKLKALIVGGMTEMKDNEVPFGMTAEGIILDAVKEYNYPVCFGFPAGHVDDNRALRLGMNCELEVMTEGFSFRQ